MLLASEYCAYPHTDHLDTPRLVTDATGTTVWKWDQQEPFGDSVPDDNPSGLGSFDLPLRLPGQRYDKETGLHYNYFRQYDASLGRYDQSDPIGLAGGANPFAYAYDPLTQIDPRGLMGRAPGTYGAGSGMPSGPQDPGYLIVVQAISIVLPVLPFPGVIGETSCGSYGFRAPNVFDTSSIQGACAAHDKCYGTCGVWKDDCDKKFKTDIRQACGSGVRCVVGAEIYYQVVQRAGEKAFLDARDHCRHGGCPQSGGK